MTLYKVKIQTERLATASNPKEAALAVLKDLEIDLKFRECPAIEVSEAPSGKANGGKEGA